MISPDRVPAEIARLFAVVRREPRHFGALMQLGTLLAQSGNAAAARTAYAQAARVHPNVAAPQVCLGTLLVDAGEHDAALRSFDAALALEPANREAQRGVAIVREREGDHAAAEAAWRRGFPAGSFETSTFRGSGRPVELLYLTSALGGNVPMQHVFDDRVFRVTTLIAESLPRALGPLPEHDAVFNAIGDADRCARGLAGASRVAEASTAPVFNDPARVAATTRLHNARRLGTLPDVATARVVTLARDALTANGPAALAAAGLDWPVLLRSPGFQTGEHFVLVERASALPDAVAGLPGATLLALEFIDSRDASGAFRKYRVMTIGGRLYPIHLAVAPQWKVHYFRSAMAERADYREEEAAFLGDMARALGRRAIAALECVARTLGLDYGGIDFTLLPDGRVLVFEANATMVLVPPDGDRRWDYRRAAFTAAVSAAREMLVSRVR